jgi:oligosaccharyltransferase complex subunit delta (ribophorin II)
MTGEQAVKFANYLMSRKSVQQPKGGFHLLEAVLAMANNKQHLPVSVSLAGSVAVSAAHPVITVLVSDLAGGSLGPMDVTLDSATRQVDGAVILANEKLQQNTLVEGDQSMRYTLDLMKSGPPAGFYELLVSAVPAKADSRLVGNSKVVVPVKILTTIAIEEAELRISDTDQSTDGKARKLNFPAKLKEALAADNTQQIKIKFSVKDESAGAKMLVHQAFVRVANKETGAEIIYVAQANNNKVYSFELDIGGQAKEFKSVAGVYSVSVVLGDATLTNPVAWAVADVDISFGGDDAAAGPAASPYANKPEIKHTFRLPEKRPSELVSNLFTIICLSPILLVLGLWMKLGVNISNFPVSVAGLGFHAGLGGIFTLYMYFFLQLNMFTTVKYLVLIGLVTFLCGNSLLSKIARNNTKK